VISFEAIDIPVVFEGRCRCFVLLADCMHTGDTGTPDGLGSMPNQAQCAHNI
jgi:hypothetical protein